MTVLGTYSLKALNFDMSCFNSMNNILLSHHHCE